MPAANLSFLPWIRQGAAGAISTVDTLGSAQPAVADVSVALKVNSEAVPEVPLRLRGPADVVGIDRHQVVRTDPRPNTSDFEPNCFPSIEFDRADFPWLFTPAKANTNGQLRPWLCLVVVRQQDGVQLTSVPDAPLPQLRIAAPAKPFIELPDLKDCWAWAHGQAAADSTVDPDAVGAALNGAPHLSLSRLVCPRLLTPNTDYLACVVPAFNLGRKAGLGQAIADAELTAVNASAPAWTLTATAPTQVQLPVYYSWQFRTGEVGDFASLACSLKIRVPAGLGQRTVVIGKPGFNVPGLDPKTTVQVEGALMPLKGNPPPVVWSDPVAPVFESALKDIVNQPNQIMLPYLDPRLAPPLYGRWYAGRAMVTPGAANWLDSLNLDPRWRSAAAIGTEVIQEHQEALMASAWEQAAAVQSVNQRLRQIQVSMAVGESLHARHLSPLSEEMTLRFASPAFSRLRMPTSEIDPAGRTVTAIMAGTSLPVPATRTAMRRIGRQRGPLSRRIAAKGAGRSIETTWVACLKQGVALTSPAPPRPEVVQAVVPTLPTVEAVVGAIWNRGFQVAAENQPLPPLPAADPLPSGWDYPGHFRKAAADHLARVGLRPDVSFSPHITIGETAAVVREQMHPRVALANLVRAAIRTGDNVLPPTAPGVTPIGTETVLMEPSFPQPMYEALKEKSQELLLPGLEKVLPDTVLGLKTNRAFVEAYMIGLNVEMARELLWRGFPTDQRGTYFRNFWGRAGAATPVSDIGDLRENLGRALGTAPPNTPANQFVLLLRSSLLRRYPNAIIYLTPAVTGTGTRPPDLHPIFNGAMDPDVSFVGFPIAPATAIGGGGNPGYYVVIQEHPTEPRFGLDDPVTRALLATRTHLAVGTQPPAGVPLKGRTWGRNSAHMADITRRRPVRITIHASQLVSLP
jgi:hypothetical protein